MFTLYRIGFTPARVPYRIGLLFTHKDSDFGAISVTEQTAPRRSPIAKVDNEETPVWLLHGSSV